MAIDLQGIARLVGVGDAGSASGTAPAGAAGFVTTVKRATETTPFETVIRKAAAEHLSLLQLSRRNGRNRKLQTKIPRKTDRGQ